MTPWASVEDDLEFAEPGKYSSQSQTGQAKIFKGREDWSLLLELNLWNVLMMRPRRDNRRGNVLCSCMHTRRLMSTRWCRSATVPACHSLIHAVTFESQDVLLRQTFAVAGQKFSPSGILHVHFCQDLLPREIWSFEVPRPEKSWTKPGMLCWIQELSVNTHDPECGNL